MFFILIPNIPFNWYVTFSSLLCICIPVDAFGNPRCTHPHLVSSSPPLPPLQISPRLVLAPYHGHLNYAFRVRSKPQKALHIWLDKLYLRLEMCKGSLLFYSLLSLQILLFCSVELFRCKNRKLTESWWNLSPMFHRESRSFLATLKGH